MATENDYTPYIAREAGDLWTAEDWKGVQVLIKKDIQDQIGSAKEEIKKTGVDRADNADKFDNKTPKDWTDDLDQRYSLKVHDHEELAAYRRYFKQMEPGDTIVLEHKLGRLPLVDVYELRSILPEPADGDPIPEKFYLYYHHEERDRDELFTQDRGRARWPWGVPIEQLLTEYQVVWEDDDSLGDVINDFLDAFFAPPTDHITHRTSPWIDEHRGRTIDELKTRDEWPDIRWAFRPYKLIVGSPVYVSGTEEDGSLVMLTPWVSVVHLSYDTLEITAADPLLDEGGSELETIDLMILLRS